MKKFYLLALAAIITVSTNPNPNDDEPASHSTDIEQMDVDRPREERRAKRKSDDMSYSSEPEQPRKIVKPRHMAYAPSGKSSVTRHAATPCEELSEKSWYFPPFIHKDQYIASILGIVAHATQTKEHEWRLRYESGYVFVDYIVGEVPEYSTYASSGIQVGAFKKALNMIPGQTTEEQKEAIDDFMLAENGNYKIHMTVPREYIHSTLERFVRTLKASGHLNYKFKILARSPEELPKEMAKGRTFPTIVLYIPNSPIDEKETDTLIPNPATSNENIQRLFNALYTNFQHCTQLNTGIQLRNNCGGPVVWIAGGDADLKPGGGYYYLMKNIPKGYETAADLEGDSPTLAIYRQIGEWNGLANYPYYKTQAPIKVHSGICSEITK